jgi:hypothetical protein
MLPNELAHPGGMPFALLRAVTKAEAEAGDLPGNRGETPGILRAPARSDPSHSVTAM